MDEYKVLLVSGGEGDGCDHSDHSEDSDADSSDTDAG